MRYRRHSRVGSWKSRKSHSKPRCIIHCRAGLRSRCAHSWSSHIRVSHFAPHRREIPARGKL